MVNMVAGFSSGCRCRRQGQTGEEPKGFFDLAAISKNPCGFFSFSILAPLKSLNFEET
jgi:hypothetical protein